MDTVRRIPQTPSDLFFVGLLSVLFGGCGCLSEHKSNNALDIRQWDSYVGSGTGIWVSIRDQQLRLIANGQIVRRYACSTARAGIGSEQDSG